MNLSSKRWLDEAWEQAKSYYDAGFSRKRNSPHLMTLVFDWYENKDDQTQEVQWVENYNVDNSRDGRDFYGVISEKPNYLMVYGKVR